MKTVIKNKWIDALLSDDYEQTTGQLGRYADSGPDKYCCLGVLCDIMLDDDAAPVRLDERNGPWRDIKFNEGQGSVLPYELAAYLGVEAAPTYTMEFDPEREFISEWGFFAAPFDDRGTFLELELADLNDSGFSFAQIADVIRWFEPDDD